MAESILQLPVSFELDGKMHAINPKTLGQELVLRRYLKALDIDQQNMETNSIAEALHVAQVRPLETARVIAVCMVKTPSNARNPVIIESLASKLANNADASTLATLLILCIDEDQKVRKFCHFAKIDKDRENIRRISQVKDTGTSFTFLGKTMYGQIIDTACQRYGWTLDYILWGISYTNLQMMIADQITTMYLSEDERRKVRLTNVPGVIDASDPANADRIRQMFNN